MTRVKKAQPIKDQAKTSRTNGTGRIIYAHGGRKTASARVRLFKNNGQITVNDKPIGEYFRSKVWESFWQKPFILTDTLGKLGATVKVEGSGPSSQLGAVIHGLARALAEFDASFRPKLKTAGLLTRDPRARERRKYGLAQKARKGKQSPRR